MSTNLEFDICVIGAGAGGLSVAAGASQLGIKVALIEARHMGGDCLNYGCVPSKTLLACAKHYYFALNSKKYGFTANPAPIKISEIMAKVQLAIKTIEPHDSIERFTKLGVTVFQGLAKFISPKQVLVNDTLISAQYFVIATGSSPFIPPIPGLNQIKYMTNETIFSLIETPLHLLVLGGGPVGCEMAQAFAMLGIKVTLIVRGAILPKSDHLLTSMLRTELLENGINLLEQTLVDNFKEIDGAKIEASYIKDGTLQKIVVSHVLLATGRFPAIDSLNLGAAGVLHTTTGVVVDNRLRTTAKKIFAVGDITGGYQFTHVAGYHAGIVIRNILFRQRATVNYAAVPRVTYTYPELAQAGLSEKKAHYKYRGKIKTTEFSLQNNDRAVTEQQTTGKIRLITTKSGKVLGVSILSSNAGELISLWVDLINRGDKVKEITKNMVPYPTFYDINKQVVGEYYKSILFNSKVRWLVKLLKILW